MASASCIYVSSGTVAWLSDPSICYNSLSSDSRPSPDRDWIVDLIPDSALLLSWSQEDIYGYVHSFLYPGFRLNMFCVYVL